MDSTNSDLFNEMTANNVVVDTLVYKKNDSVTVITHGFTFIWHQYGYICGVYEGGNTDERVSGFMVAGIASIDEFLQECIDTAELLIEELGSENDRME